MKSHDDWTEALSAKRRREAQRAENRITEALQSPKWGNKLVAQHALKWLKSQGHVDPDQSLDRTVEVLLWRMVGEYTFAAALGKILDCESKPCLRLLGGLKEYRLTFWALVWKGFVDNGGMKKADYISLKDDQTNFAYVTLLLSLIESSVTAGHGSLALDLQECMRIWKTVRLG